MQSGVYKKSKFESSKKLLTELREQEHWAFGGGVFCCCYAVGRNSAEYHEGLTLPQHV